MDESGGQKREEELSSFSSAQGWGLFGEGRGFQHPGGWSPTSGGSTSDRPMAGDSKLVPATMEKINK